MPDYIAVMNSKCYHVQHSDELLMLLYAIRMNVSFILDNIAMTITIPVYHHIPGGNEHRHGFPADEGVSTKHNTF